MTHQKMARRTSTEAGAQLAVVLLVLSFHLFNDLRSALTVAFSGMLALMSTSCRQNSQFFQNLKWSTSQQTDDRETKVEAAVAVAEVTVAVVEAAVVEAATPEEAEAAVAEVTVAVAETMDVAAAVAEVTVAAVEATGAAVAVVTVAAVAADEAAVAAVAVATVVAETATAADALGSEQETEAVVLLKIPAPMIAAQAAHRRVTGANHEGNPTNLRINLAKASVEAKQIEATTNHPRVDSRAAETVARIESKNVHSSSLTVAGGENTP